MNMGYLNSMFSHTVSVAKHLAEGKRTICLVMVTLTVPKKFPAHRMDDVGNIGPHKLAGLSRHS